MNIQPTTIPEVLLLEPAVFADARGYFVETYRQDKLDAALGFALQFVQDNESKSGYGVLRGLHYQLPPFAQTKLVRVVVGSVLDVAVDIRVGSPTFAQHVVAELTAENKRQLLIPRGFAHGFVVTSETAILAYKVDNFYSPAHDRGLLYNDPDLAIDWEVAATDLILSAKDLQQPLLKNAADSLFQYGSRLY